MAVQKLMTAELRKCLPPLYTNENTPPDDVKVIAKFFHAYGRGTFLLTEYDGEDTLFGYTVGLGGDEWGYMSLAELTNLRAHIGGRTMPFQAIERDTSFRPKTWGEIKDNLNQV